MYDYFYGEQSEQFSFYRIPKILFTGEQFKDISVEAKVLYGILLDRMSLSAKNGWMDKEGRVYIIFTVEEVMSAMNCADNKATKLMAELENKAGLIVRSRQGLGRPNRIFVKNFISSIEKPEDKKQADQESRFLNRENHDSGIAETTIPESPKSRPNNTDINDTDKNNTDPVIQTPERMKEPESWTETKLEQKARQALVERSVKEKYLRHSLEFDLLLYDYPDEEGTLNGILRLMLDVLCTEKPFIRVNRENVPAEVVKSSFMAMNSDHIRYVLRSLKENTTEIKDMDNYLLTTLYNSSITKDPYYRALVNSHTAKECSSAM